MKLQLHCDKLTSGCPAIINLRHLSEHVAQCCPPYPCSQSQSSTVPLLPVSSSSSIPTTPPRLPLASRVHTLTPSKISAILDRPLEMPLSGAEKKAVTHLVKCAIHVGANQSTGGGTSETQRPQVLELPTGGQVGSHTLLKLSHKNASVEVLWCLTYSVASLLCSRTQATQGFKGSISRHLACQDSYAFRCPRECGRE